MGRMFILFLMGLFFSTINIAQIAMQVAVPAVGLIQKSQLWNITIVNSSSLSYEAKLNLQVQDRISGLNIGSATTESIVIKPGVTQLNFGNLASIQYNSSSGSADFKNSSFMSPGSYLACYNLMGITEKVDLAEDCVEFDVEPLTPPMLTHPQDSAVLEMDPSQFTWISPTPLAMFNNLNYDIIITPVNSQQKAEEAIQHNTPFYSGNLLSTFFSYPSSLFHFDKDVWYAWQIIARNEYNFAGKSETWVFKVKTPEKRIFSLDEFPYIEMKKTSYLKGIAPNGILKVSYKNESNDSTIQLKLFDVNAGSASVTPIDKTLILKQGDNLIEIDVSKKLAYGHIYEARLENSRGEHYRVLFELQKIKIAERD